MTDTQINQGPAFFFRGSIRFKLLGQDYELMKPSLYKHVYVLVREETEDEVDTTKPENQKQIIDLFGDSDYFKDADGKKVALTSDGLSTEEDQGTFSKYIKSFKITHLTLAVVPRDDKSDYLFQIGAKVEFQMPKKDEPTEHVDGIGWGDWFRLNSIEVLFVRDYIEEKINTGVDSIQQRVLNAVLEYEDALEEDLLLATSMERIRHSRKLLDQ